MQEESGIITVRAYGRKVSVKISPHADISEIYDTLRGILYVLGFAHGTIKKYMPPKE
jgi:hypothetical protein